MSFARSMKVAQSDRRWFLVKASAAAMAGLAIGGEIILDAQTPSEPAPGIQNFTAAQLHDDIAALASTPGDNKLVNLPTFTVALTVEKNKAQEQFEWHEGRDHVFQILEGSTFYELGGTPKNPRSTKPGEWNSPDSENAEKLTLNKGDLLVIPRGTPHRRTTKGSVTLLLISPQGSTSRT
jgi:mannose-6-phosphate isomerase-like protein (cupin superfamily)